ncbi:MULTISPECIES: hypothetical protein [Streptomyces]|uniref:Uncharacterized protein n=1 Tax=Streptomyces sudanensis TaxID=436397 RepID=A0ABY4TCQ7_9ACTN|nr:MULTISPECIES: hypothetical protein [Streptomyces]URN16729.1 hypothetical protein MW084_13095 [Streptomyces sudanensis]
MSGEPELRLPPDIARLLAEGIDKAHGELKGLTSIGDAAAGNGFSGLALSAMELGHRGLADEFGAFCDRWGWGVRTLMQRGNEFAVAVGLAAGWLHEQDQYVKGTVKVVVNGINGNPHLSEEEVQAKSWEEIRDQRPTDGADWSGESLRAAHEEVKQVNKDVAYDVMYQSTGTLEDLGVYDSGERERMEALQREVFDPSDEAVRRAGGSPEDAG